MKKYLFGFFAVVLAVGFSAYTKPAKNAFADFYRFTYQLPTDFSQTSVQTENIAKWGYGTLVSAPDQFSGACGDVDDKACELIVPINSTVSTLSGRRLKSIDNSDPASSDNVVIVALLGSETGKYYVDASLGTHTDGAQNKD